MHQRDLVERAGRGDHDAFAVLVRGSIARLEAVARLILRDPELARDAVQEAYDLGSAIRRRARERKRDANAARNGVVRMSLLGEHGSIRRRSQVVPTVIAALMLLAVTVGPASATQASGEWHRNNYGFGHERLMCREATPSWSCVYDNVSEPGLPASDSVAHFTGRNVTDSWSCPTWFDATVCDNVVAVYRGVATYISSGNHRGTFHQEYIVTNVGGQEILQQYFVDQFYCPWFRTWEEALAADFECTFAP